ncbi:MAG: hypothetical protein ACI9UU_001214 [Candidatus Azotimanducaceae bacterium]|jgi:hypothetical protein
MPGLLQPKDARRHAHLERLKNRLPGKITAKTAFVGTIRLTFSAEYFLSVPSLNAYANSEADRPSVVVAYATTPNDDE